MKKYLTLVIAALLLVIASAGAPMNAQEGEEEEDPELCDLLPQTRDAACKKADKAGEDAETVGERMEALRLNILCVRLKADVLEFCPEADEGEPN